MASELGGNLRRPAQRRLLVHPGPAAATLGVAVAPGVTCATPFGIVAGQPGGVLRVPRDIGPDGASDGKAELVRSIDATPCGQGCARRPLQRWCCAPIDGAGEGRPAGGRASFSGG